jgi:hypothetical protein
MFDDLFGEKRPDFPAAGQFASLPTEEQEIQAVNSREELLLRARGITRRIRERVWKLMGGQGMQGPHNRPAEEEASPDLIEERGAPNHPPSRP